MGEHRYFVYIMASKPYGTLYVGITRDLARRTYQHKHDLIEGFTSRYGVHALVWFEEHADVNIAIAREKQIKGWNRAWKIRLIEKGNPNWEDLFPRIGGSPPDLSFPAERTFVREGKGIQPSNIMHVLSRLDPLPSPHAAARRG